MVALFTLLGAWLGRWLLWALLAFGFSLTVVAVAFYWRTAWLLGPGAREPEADTRSLEGEASDGIH